MMVLLRSLLWAMVVVLATIPSAVRAEEQGRALPLELRNQLASHCTYCHDASTSEGELDLESLALDLGDAKTLDRWIHVYDRIERGEMPPPDNADLDEDDRKAMLAVMRDPLTRADLARKKATHVALRRLNREEYENSLRQVLAAPWLVIADDLPHDGTQNLFSKSADSLGVSHVHMERYLAAAQHALRLAVDAAAHPTATTRYYARNERTMRHYARFNDGNRNVTRSIVPLDELAPEIDIIRGKAPFTVGDADPEKRAREAMGVFCGTFVATTKYDFRKVIIPTDGLYRLRFKSYTFRAGPNGANGGKDHGLTGGNRAWWRPDKNVILRGNRSEPVTLYALNPSGGTRWLTVFDSFPDPTVHEVVAPMKQGEGIRPDATRLVRTRPGYRGNPNATREGVPGLAINWLEVEGPLHEVWPPASYHAVFGDLDFQVVDGRVKAQTTLPDADARRLLRRFAEQATRQPSVSDGQLEPYVKLYERSRVLGVDFTDAMLAAYSALLCSPEFMLLEQPGGDDDQPHALASRLSYFLWNGPPDAQLVEALATPSAQVLRKEVDRLLDDPRSIHFQNTFLDYWLDLRDIGLNSPDAELYPDYFLDDWLQESSLAETRRFFRELIEKNLSVRNLVDSDFAFVNERLAEHYQLPAREGARLVRVALPADSPRGGLVTQASVLKVTANGTTTSPVLRGVWLMERIAGVEIGSPPSGVPAIEPDIRGAKTIHEQLVKHRAEASCMACHRRFDPAGFALESFDVAGGWRDRYRIVSGDGKKVDGIGKNGHRFRFLLGDTVYCEGDLSGVGKFKDVNEFKKLLARDQRQLARNLLYRLVAYSTGEAPSFSDRDALERVLDQAKESEYGVRSLITALVESGLFRE